MLRDKAGVLVDLAGFKSNLYPLLTSVTGADDKITVLKAILGNYCSLHPYPLVQFKQQPELAVSIKYIPASVNVKLMPMSNITADIV